MASCSEIPAATGTDNEKAELEDMSLDAGNDTTDFDSGTPTPAAINEPKLLDLEFPLTPQTNVSNVVVKLKVDAKDGCGGHAWPAGETLASYIVRKGSDYLYGKNVVELGSGTGLVGLVAGKLGAKVCVTDQIPMLSLMNENVALNSLKNSVQVEELNWGEPSPPKISRPIDLLLAADCVYFEPAFPLLVQTLRELVDENTECLFAYAKRRKADKRFFALLKKSFTWEEIEANNDKPTDSPAPVYLYRLHKRP